MEEVKEEVEEEEEEEELDVELLVVLRGQGGEIRVRPPPGKIPPINLRRSPRLVGSGLQGPRSLTALALAMYPHLPQKITGTPDPSTSAAHRVWG